jgi:hypothetical protein
MDRKGLVRKLVSGVHLSIEERQALGSFIRREEIAAAISHELERWGRFPLDTGGGWQLVLVPTGAQLARRRNAIEGSPLFAEPADAIDRYIDCELGPTCGGLPVRSGG